MAISDFILLVENEALIAMSLGAALEEEAYLIEGAANGFDAIAAISAVEAGSHELLGVITDINLGRGLNGWDVARRARVFRSMLPIVYISGCSAREHEARGVANSAMVEKPFRDATVVADISQLIDTVKSRNLSNPLGHTA